MAEAPSFVTTLLQAGRGEGGAAIVVRGQPASRGERYWAGYSFAPAKTLFEAVLRCVLGGKYERVVVFSAETNGHLPRHIRPASTLTLGDEPVIWVGRGAIRPPQSQSTARKPVEPWGSLEDIVGPRLERVLWRGAHHPYWARIRKLLEIRDQEIASGKRAALVVDTAFLEPTGSDWDLFDGAQPIGLAAAEANAITDRFPVDREKLRRADLIFFSESPIADAITAPDRSLLREACEVTVPRWADQAAKLQFLLPRYFTGTATVVGAQRLENPVAPVLDPGVAAESSLYDTLRAASLSHRRSIVTRPADPSLVALDFWANLDLDPLKSALDAKIIGQKHVTESVLRVLATHQARCARLLTIQPAARKTSRDRDFLLPILGFFGAAGMGKTTFCRVITESLFGDSTHGEIVDFSSKLLATETIGVAPPYEGANQESGLMRYARLSGGLGTICFDEFTRIERHQQSLADALSPLLEIVEKRSFVPANPRLVPAERRYHLTNSLLIFAANLGKPGEPVPAGFQSVDDLGDAFKRRAFGGGQIFYFEPLQREDYADAFRVEIRQRVATTLADYFPDDAGAGRPVVVTDDLIQELMESFDDNLAFSGSSPSLALVNSEVRRLNCEAAIEQAITNGLDTIVIDRSALS
jgi:hypothetical protein